MPFWKRRTKSTLPSLTFRGSPAAELMTQEKEEALWNETRDNLREIATLCGSRSGPWIGIGKMADKIVSRITYMDARLKPHPGRVADIGSNERFNYLSEQMVILLEIDSLVAELKFEVDMANLIEKSCPEAQHLLGDTRVCLVGTCESVLADIELWAKDPNRPPIYWLKGPRQTGKSTIARTIVEKMFRDGSLGATFFLSRDLKLRGLASASSIVSTIALQLADKYPQFRSALVVRTKNPSLRVQINELIIQPLKKSNTSTLIVIDSLHECEDGELVLSILGRLVPEIPQVKFLITGRPEEIIQGEFNRLDKQTVHVFTLDHEWVPSE